MARKQVALAGAGVGVFLFLAGCTTISTDVNPETIAEGSGKTTVFVKLKQDGKPLAGKPVTFAVTEGEHCGGISPETATTDAKGMTQAVFQAAAGLENCSATVRVASEGAASSARIRVKPLSLGGVKIDGVSAIALVLIASFAIDRIVRGLLFVLGFFPFWAARFSDPDDPEASPRQKRFGRLAYFAVAAVLSTVILAGYGGVRIFSAMGFNGIDPLLDTLVTGLILVGGAERTEAILKSIGGGGAEAGAASSTPLQISGTLILADRTQGAAKSAAAGGESA
jgi:hypothetical protein